VWRGVDQEFVEAAAEEVRRIAGLDGAEEFTGGPAIVRAAGGSVNHDVPRGMHGMLVPETLTVSVRDGSPTVVNEGVGHELGHLGAWLHKLPQSEALATEIGKGVLVPESLCKALFRAHGWNAPALLRAVPEVPAAWVLGRVAAFFEGVCVLRTKRDRTLYGPPGLQIRAELRAFEREYLRIARESEGRVAKGFLNIQGWVMGRAGAEWSVILVPPDALVMLEAQRELPAMRRLFGDPLDSAA